MTEEQRPGIDDAATAAPPLLPDEEQVGAESSPRKDLASAILIAGLACAVMLLSLDLDRPEGISTAPGLLPFVTAAALLAMALSLGWRAVRQGAARAPLEAFAAAARAAVASTEDRRAALLAMLVLAYVLLVASISFELRVSTTYFDFVLSGYELVSIAVVTTVLRIFWRASLLRCLLVSAACVEVLALIFRYGFNMIMPEVF